MVFIESIRSAFRSLVAHKLRSGLTLLSMAIGVFAIVGVGGAVAVLEGSLQDQLVSLGSEDLVVRSAGRDSFGRSRSRPFSVDQARLLVDRLSPHRSTISVSLPSSIVSRGRLESEGVVELIGVDENYLVFDDRSVAHGRTIASSDVDGSESVVLLGADVAAALEIDASQIGATVDIGGYRYTVIGIAASKGSAFGRSRDAFAAIPITRTGVHSSGRTVDASLMARSGPLSLDELRDRAIARMRGIRRLGIEQENDFEVTTQQDIAESISGFTKYIVFFGVFSGAVALLAAGIGVMNIMLVTVRERRREIGVRKAVGATRSNIVLQFLVESLTICQIGAAIGIGFGLLATGGLSVALDAPLRLGIQGLIGSVLGCLLVGLLFGTWPALRASRLDAIESLRYE